MTEEKRCYRCRERKELEYFWQRQKWCIRCMRAWRRRPEVRARYRAVEQRQRDRHRSQHPRPVPVRNERGQFTGAFA